MSTVFLDSLEGGTVTVNVDEHETLTNIKQEKDDSIEISTALNGPFHEVSHDKRLFTCVYCSKQFRKEENLAIHQASHSSNDYVCKGCRCSFKTEELLKEHNEKKHTIPCEICGQVFRSEHNLKEHKLVKHECVNSPVRIFICPYCGKRFMRHAHLESHVNTKHTGEKPYSCKTCCKRFGSKSGQTQHEILCGKNYKSEDKDVLLCKVCGQTFKHRGSLKHHMDAVHNMRKAKCPKCLKEFKYKSNMSRHLRTCIGTMEREKVDDNVL